MVSSTMRQPTLRVEQFGQGGFSGYRNRLCRTSPRTVRNRLMAKVADVIRDFLRHGFVLSDTPHCALVAQRRQICSADLRDPGDTCRQRKRFPCSE
jgi:hypothetical protein